MRELYKEHKTELLDLKYIKKEQKTQIQDYLDKMAANAAAASNQAVVDVATVGCLVERHIIGPLQ